MGKSSAVLGGLPSDPWKFQRWAFEQRTGNTARKSVLTLLAVMADKETGRCQAKQETIAQAVEASERSVRQHLAKLQADGFIDRRSQYRRDGSRRSDEFLLLAPGIFEWPDGQPANSAGGEIDHRQNTTEVVSHSAGQEQATKEQPLGIERADAPAEILPKGVNAEAWRQTVEILADFNSQAGTKLGAVNGLGAPSDSAKRIYSRVREFPGLGRSEWSGIIRRTLVSRWWGADKPSVGVVFGPKVFEQNMGRDDVAAKPVRDGRTAVERMAVAMAPVMPTGRHEVADHAARSDWAAVKNRAVGTIGQSAVEIWLDALHVHGVDAGVLEVGGDAEHVGVLANGKFWRGVEIAAEAEGNTIRLVRCDHKTEVSG